MIIHQLPHDMISLEPEPKVFAFDPRFYMACQMKEVYISHACKADYIIMMNGRNEKNQSLPESELMNLCQVLRPNEIVIPDDEDFESHASIAMRFQNRFPNAKIVMNIQGKTAKELTDSFFRINHSPSTNKIGIPDLQIERSALLTNLNIEIYYKKINIIPILIQEICSYSELDMMSYRWLKDSTIITTRAIRLAMDGILLSDSLRQEPKKRNIEKFRLKYLEFPIAYNWNKIKLEAMSEQRHLSFNEWINQAPF